MSFDFATVPNRLPWPPIIYLTSGLLAVLLAHMSPWSCWLAHRGGHLVGLMGFVVMLMGVISDVAAMLAMRRHRANILPHRAATALVTTWPFSWSRNPIYFGNLLLLIGAGFAFNNIWFFPAALCSYGLVTILAIKREEAHLAYKFGSLWTSYAQSTPRWINLSF